MKILMEKISNNYFKEIFINKKEDKVIELRFINNNDKGYYYCCKADENIFTSIERHEPQDLPLDIILKDVELFFFGEGDK